MSVFAQPICIVLRNGGEYRLLLLTIQPPRSCLWHKHPPQKLLDRMRGYSLTARIPPPFCPSCHCTIHALLLRSLGSLTLRDKRRRASTSPRTPVPRPRPGCPLHPLVGRTAYRGGLTRACQPSAKEVTSRAPSTLRPDTTPIASRHRGTTRVVGLPEPSGGCKPARVRGATGRALTASSARGRQVQVTRCPS